MFELATDTYRSRRYLYARLAFTLYTLLCCILLAALMITHRNYDNYEGYYSDFLAGFCFMGPAFTLLIAPFDLLHPKSPRWAALTSDVIAFGLNAGWGSFFLAWGSWVIDEIGGYEWGPRSGEEREMEKLWLAVALFLIVLAAASGGMMAWSAGNVHRERKERGRYVKRASEVYEMQLGKVGRGSEGDAAV